MEEFKFIKERNFSELLQDTFGFIKVYQKDFIKNFTFLALLSTLFYVIFFVLLSAYYMNAGSLVAFIGFIIIGFVYCYFQLLTNVYPISFIELVREQGNSSFSFKELVAKMIPIANKSVLFFLASIPMLVLIALSITLAVMSMVGIPFILFMLPFFMVWTQLTLIDYAVHGLPIYSSYGKNFTRIFSKFWPIIGSVIILFIIVVVISGVTNLIPALFGEAVITAASVKMVDIQFFGVVFLAINFILSQFFSLPLSINIVLIHFNFMNEDTISDIEIDQLGQ
jgi:hypothetical protein